MSVISRSKIDDKFYKSGINKVIFVNIICRLYLVMVS